MLQVSFQMPGSGYEFIYSRAFRLVNPRFSGLDLILPRQKNYKSIIDRKTFMGLAKILLFCVLLSFSFAKAQAQYRFDHWTTDNGLPQNTVRQMVQTSDGYLWFTTLDGLVRFDGVRFTVFNKANSKNLPGNRFV